MAGKAKKLTPEQVDRVVRIELMDARRKHRTRNVLMLLLTHKAGLRPQEVAYLEVADITDVEGELAEDLHVTKRAAKYGKEREIPLKEEMKGIIATYLKTSGIQSGRLFWGQFRRPMTPNGVSKELGRMYKRAGFLTASGHSGRRTFITNLAVEAPHVGATLADVQRLAGHADIRTTEIYLSPSGRERELVNRLPTNLTPEL